MDDLNLAGLYVPLVTPFTPNGDLAPECLERIAHTVIDEGAAGVVALGTTGEPATLTAEERRTVLDICARVCRERSATLIAGAGSNDTRASALALAELKAWPEISAALTVVPYYTRPSEQGVIAHFTVLARQSPVPLVVYNIPCRTSLPCSAATTRSCPRCSRSARPARSWPRPTCAPPATPTWRGRGARAGRPRAGHSGTGWPFCPRRCSPSRTPWSSRRCCTPRAGFPALTCGCRCSRPAPALPGTRRRRRTRPPRNDHTLGPLGQNWNVF